MKYDRFALIGLPPTANNIYVERGDGKGRVKTTEYLKWRTAASRTLREEIDPFRAKTPIQLEAYICATRQRDVDNCKKPIIDAVKEAKLITDDRWVDRIEAWRCDGTQVPAGMVMLYLDYFDPFALIARLVEIQKARKPERPI